MIGLWAYSNSDTPVLGIRVATSPYAGWVTRLISCIRIDRVIQVRSNIDPTFYSLVGSGQFGGTTMAPLFSIIHTSLIKHLTTYLHRLRTTRLPLSSWGDGEIVPFEHFFHAFPRGPKKAAINKIFLILPS
ncbi:hypothetical protein V6Z12_D13G147500 [Gossypium hirsutum]